MTVGRWSGIIERYNNRILDTLPGNVTLRRTVQEALQRTNIKNGRVLEFGSGRGELTTYILHALIGKKCVLHTVDPNITEYPDTISGYRTSVIHEQKTVLEHLACVQDNTYDAIVSGWTLHNFPHDEQEAVLRESYRTLRHNGAFILFDKVFPDDDARATILQLQQFQRYDYLLPKEAADAMKAHEQEDAQWKYRLVARPLTRTFFDLGYSNAYIRDRVDRDVVMVAYANKEKHK